jgi:energy-coupling factor transporter ATP-binding protein EcfA2
MDDYKKIKNQFYNFIKSLKLDELSSCEKKLINLIYDNFENVAELGTAQGYRAYYIYDLIKNNRTTVSDILIIEEERSIDEQYPIKSLHSLEVESFRGFSKKGNFNFDRSKILVYGPNGSGKTSFCESLEYALLNYLSEAGAKRMNNEAYITNVDTGNFIKPILKGLAIDESIIEISPNSDLYYFCFIEKNRIIDFARYSAKTESKQTDLLASLFGLDDFYSFINEFTKNIYSYIPIEPEKQKELDKKKAGIEFHKKNIEISKIKIEDLKNDKTKVIEDSKLNKSFDELHLYINGNTESKIKGRIDLIDEELQKPAPKKYDYKNTDELLTEIQSIEKLIQTFKNINERYNKEKNKINFRKIFEAVKEFEQIITDKCPVCETPISETKINPYDNAKNKLKELEEIALIENERNQGWETIVESVSDFFLSFEKRIKDAKDFAKEILVTIHKSLTLSKHELNKYEEYLTNIEACIKNIKQQKDLLVNLDLDFKSSNNKADKNTETCNLLNIEKANLKNLKERIDKIKTQEKTYNDAIVDGGKAIAEFDEANKTLIQSVEAEKLIIEENKKYIEAYTSFLSRINSYKNQLPISLVSNLSTLTKEFYNCINQDDSKFELIEKIELPSKAGERINIWFQDAPDDPIDAMHILSEGHTRCLGLAILLAKVVQKNLPFIIFDDVVNAIDDDHRGRISKLLLENEKLKNKQIIITSHSEEYIREIENKHFTKEEYKNTVKVITFLKPEKRNINIVETEVFNYLVQANDFLKLGNKKDALERCRKTLENIGDLLWKKLSNNDLYDSSLSVSLRSPKSKPELRTLIESLKKKFEKLNVPKFNAYIPFLSWVLELEKKDKLIWDYLNKGTHEESDRDDFDITIVTEIVEELTKFDKLLKNPPKVN